MAFTIDDWSQDFKSVSSTVSQLLSTPLPLPPTSLPNCTRAISRLRLRLTEVQTSPENFAITPPELAKFNVMLNNLEGQFESLKSYSSKPIVGSGGGGGDKSQNAYMQTTQTVMEAQDDMLDELGSGISRLHDQAQMINDESNLHVKLLDDMEGGVEAATMGLRAEAKHAEKIREQSSVCKLYIVIAGLTGLLVFLLVMGFSH
ncbi:hypothetical protein TrLO_g15067 [Triparma laevis f. longispina]|uniref:t-SNARE coiled-coil homology domain-containing protein n=1 Tax=Triparma laevis f. longispina TaxID=1714387 RepID=A0A9W7AZ99_9STRA|nr:hypothetical protein TrLO_g15067 [Triparma laevis f. longispina]